MDIDLAIANIFQDASVSRRLAALVMMFGEPVHRNRHPAARQADPLSGNRNHSAGDDQHKHSTSAEFRQNAAEFGMSHERLAADQRYMQRLMFLDQLEDTRD